jgi:hypothetical protein
MMIIEHLLQRAMRRKKFVLSVTCRATRSLRIARYRSRWMLGLTQHPLDGDNRRIHKALQNGQSIVVRQY